MNLNKAIIVGRVTADPILKSTPGGQSVTSFGVATNRSWTDKAGQKQQETQFHNVVAWGRTAEVIGQYVVKGSEILIEGRLQTRKWQDKQGGTRSTTEIVTESMQLGARPQGSADRGDADRPAPARQSRQARHWDSYPESCRKRFCLTCGLFTTRFMT